MKRAFTILEATIGALMLSCLIAVFADYFVSRATKARDSEMRTALYPADTGMGIQIKLSLVGSGI